MFRAESTRTVGGLRRRMPRHLLPAFCLLLLLLSCTCGPAYCANGGPADSVSLFVPGEKKVPEKVGDTALTEDVSSFGSPFLVGGNGVMVALAEVVYTGSDRERVDIAARYIETEGEDWEIKATENIETNWKTQLALQGKKTDNSILRNPTAVIKGNKIYLLALNSKRPSGFRSDHGWRFELAVGTITGLVGSKKIEWGSSDFLHSKLTGDVKKNGWEVLEGSSRFAFLTSKGTIVFSSKVRNKEDKLGYAILQLKDEEEQWEVSFVKNRGECRHLSLFEWKERLIRMFSGCWTGKNYAEEYDEVSKEWKDADDALFLFLSSKTTPGGVTNTTIGNKTVLLFADKRIVSTPDKRAFTLWFTDSRRVEAVGWLVETPYEVVDPKGLLYTNGQLFFMYDGFSKGSGAIVLTRLHDQMRGIKSLLNTWDGNDAYLSKLCNETAPEGASPDTPCLTFVPTDGLVGFLSNNGENDLWYDEYHYFPAWVNGRKVKNGYTFTQASEGVLWRVAGRDPGKRYDFTNYGLTVVATVFLYETPEKDSPLLTVGNAENTEESKRLGLWYKGGQWKVVSNDGKEEPAMDLETQKAYKMTLIVHNNTLSVYVDGKSRGTPLPISAPQGKPFDTKDIYIGAYKRNNRIHMTVTNVLLYNRVLSDTEPKTTSTTIATRNSTDSGNPSNTPKKYKDNSVDVHMSFTSFFLLGCFCLAVFW